MSHCVVLFQPIHCNFIYISADCFTMQNICFRLTTYVEAALSFHCIQETINSTSEINHMTSWDVNVAVGV